jgi:hypothetical protein
LVAEFFGGDAAFLAECAEVAADASGFLGLLFGESRRHARNSTGKAFPLARVLRKFPELRGGTSQD